MNLILDIICLIVFGLKLTVFGTIFLVLFDVKLNSVVSMDLVESEDIGTIYKFLDDSLRNQPKICIVSDLKDEYHPAIEKVGVRHQFCMFHTKQKINRNIREDKKRNNYCGFSSFLTLKQ